MREILFRGKRLDNGEWVEGIPIKTHIGTFVVFEDNPHYCSQYGYMEIDGLCKVDENIVCQYIGLTDKNGKKIFDGDVVIESSYIGIVYFENGEYKITWRDLDEHLRHGIAFWVKERQLEVVGNVYDSPDLLSTSSTDSD